MMSWHQEPAPEPQELQEPPQDPWGPWLTGHDHFGRPCQGYISPDACRHLGRAEAEVRKSRRLARIAIALAFVSASIWVIRMFF